jgi:hypothetical protein
MQRTVGVGVWSLLPHPDEKGGKVMTEPGLNPAHHGELNRMDAAPSRLAELREEYADDPVALQQIDVYDPDTEYYDHFLAYKDALLSGDSSVEAAELNWLTEHYGDIGG